MRQAALSSDPQHPHQAEFAEYLQADQTRPYVPMQFKICAILLLTCTAQTAEIHIYAADHSTGKFIKIKEDGTLLWDFPNNNGHDVQLVPNGNILITPGTAQEVSPDKKVVGELGKPAVGHAEAAQRLPNGNTMIADNANGAVIVDVSPDEQVVWKYDVPNHPQMRQVRRLLNGNTLISSGEDAGKNGDCLIEVDKEGKTIWKYGGEGAPKEEKLKWPAGFDLRPDGTIYVSEAHGGQIRVISPDRKTSRIIKSPAMKHAATIAVVEEKKLFI
jgi:outer membrane protein assembly factor BamB